MSNHPLGDDRHRHFGTQGDPLELVKHVQDVNRSTTTNAPRNDVVGPDVIGSVRETVARRSLPDSIGLMALFVDLGRPESMAFLAPESLDALDVDGSTLPLEQLGDGAISRARVRIGERVHGLDQLRFCLGHRGWYLTGLTEMIGTRPCWIMLLIRKNGCKSANRPCYYRIRWSGTTFSRPEPRNRGSDRARRCRAT